MASDPIYPFGLPGMNHLGGSSQGNPLAASLELMRSAMSSFGQSASLAGGSMAPTLNPDDLERRIAELKVVENWLRLNLSMLSSSIQGMEVQLATIKTLRSFVEMGSQATSADDQQPSPLEVVLGLKKAAPDAARRQQSDTPWTADRQAHDSPWPGQSRTAQTASSGSPSKTPPEPSFEAKADAASGTSSDTAPQSSASQTESSPAPDDSSTVAAKAWWDMLQNQFSQLAAATAQATKFAQTTGQDADSTQTPSSRPGAAKKSATKTAASGAAASDQSASKPRASKATAKKATSRKSSSPRTG